MVVSFGLGYWTHSQRFNNVSSVTDKESSVLTAEDKKLILDMQNKLEFEYSSCMNELNEKNNSNKDELLKNIEVCREVATYTNEYKMIVDSYGSEYLPGFTNK